MTPMQVMEKIEEMLKAEGWECEIDFQDGNGDVDYPYAMKIYTWEKANDE